MGEVRVEPTRGATVGAVALGSFESSLLLVCLNQV